MVTRAEVYGISQHEKDSVTGCGRQAVAGGAQRPWEGGSCFSTLVNSRVTSKKKKKRINFGQG